MMRAASSQIRRQDNLSAQGNNQYLFFLKDNNPDITIILLN